jgi:hypothetical protein
MLRNSTQVDAGYTQVATKKKSPPCSDARSGNGTGIPFA